MIVLAWCLGSAQGVAQGRETQRVPGTFPDLRQTPAFRKIEANRIHRAEYHRGESCPKKSKKESSQSGGWEGCRETKKSKQKSPGAHIVLA